MKIEFDTGSAQDLDVLEALVSVLKGGGAAPARKEHAPKDPPKAKSTVDKLPEPPAPEPETAPDGPALNDCVKLATDQVAKGRAAMVKGVLEEVGAERVSLIEPDKWSTFISRVRAEADKLDEEAAQG